MEDKFKKYVFMFECVFDNKEIAGEFQKFLKTEFSMENYEFVLQVDKLINLDKESEQIAFSLEILQNYILPNSPQEINLPGPVRDNIIHLFKNSNQKDNASSWLIHISPQRVFADARDSIRNTLRYDSFKRFIRTHDFQRVVVKYLDDPIVAHPALSSDFNFKDDDFHNQYTSQNDFDFIKALMQDGFDWEVLGVKSEFNSILTTYHSKVNYVVGCKFAQKHPVTALKYETVLNYPFHKAICLLPNEVFLMMDPNTLDVTYEKYIKKGETLEKDHYHASSTIKIPLLDYRYCQMTCATEYDAKEHRILHILRSRDDETKGNYMEPRMENVCLKKYSAKYGEKKSYSMFLIMGCVIQKIDEFRTHYCQISLVGLGGWADNQKMARLAYHSRGIALKRTIIKTLECIPSDLTWEEFIEKYKHDYAACTVGSYPEIKQYFSNTKWDGKVRKFFNVKDIEQERDEEEEEK